MYVEVVRNRNSPPAILLRRSSRQGTKVIKQTLANLSHGPAPRVEALRRLLRGELDCVSTDPVNGPVFGLLFVLKQIAEQLGLTAALGKTRLAKLALLLVLVRIAHPGSRLSAVRWAQDHAVAEVLGITRFDEDDLYVALDDLCERQNEIEQALYRHYLRRRGAPPTLFLYDVTSSDLEGEQNALGDYGYSRDGKRGKLQIGIGLLADNQGEPLAVRVFAGNTRDPLRLGEQIQIVKEQCAVQELVFVGDRGMGKSKGKAALEEAGFRYISALTDPQIGKLLKEGTLQLGLFDQQVCEVEADGVRYLLRKNPDEAARERHRLEDKLAKLTRKLEQRHEKVKASPRCRPEAGSRQLQVWVARHKLTKLVELRVEQRSVVWTRNQAAIDQAMELAGCYVVVTDVPQAQMSGQDVHDHYLELQRVERDFRQMKTGLLEVRPIFVRKESRTRGHVFSGMLALKLSRELERRLQAAFHSTDADPHTLTLEDALSALSRLCLLIYQIDEHTSVTRLPIPDARQRAILEALDVQWPAK